MHTNRRSTNALVLLATFAAIAVASGRVGNCQNPSSEDEQELLAVLRSDAPAADKALACKHLAIYGSSEAVPDLARLLPDESLASWSRIALEVIPGPEAAEALREATDSLHGKLLVGVINSIGVRRDEGAVATLIARLQDPDADVGSAAAVALGRIGGSAAAQTLRQALVSAPAQVRSAVAEGCVLCAERFLSEGNAAEAAEIYDDVRKADVPRQRTLEATRGAILARKQDGIPLLLEQIESPDEGLFQAALSTAREFPGHEVDNALAAAVDRTPPERAALLVLAMADRTDTVDLSAILKAAGHGSKQVRIAAIGALGRVGDATCVSPLLEMALEPDAELVETAKSALADLPDENVDKDILARLAKARGKPFSLLIELVGKRRIQAIPVLVDALDHSDPTIRSAALTSLGNTVPAESLSVLISQVVDPNHPDDAPVARQALKTASIRMPDREACAAELATAIERSSVPTQSDLLEILGAMGGSKALDTVGAAAKSADPQLQDVSSRLLGQWMTIDAAPVLLDLARTAPDDKYQIRALRGYIRIARQFNMSEQQRVKMCRNAFEAARQPAEQKLVLEVLKRYPNREMLKLALQAVQVPEVKNEATQATLAIARRLGNTDEVRERLSKADSGKVN